MKIEMPDNNTVVINDGDFVVVELPDGYGLGYNENYTPVDLIQDLQGEPTVDDDNSIDPVPYLSGGNRLTVSQSAERALWKVYQEIWELISADQIGDLNMLRDSIADMIREGMGRQAVYILAGGIKKGLKEGYYKGVPLAYVFKGFVDGVIQHPDDNPTNERSSYAMPNNNYFG